MGQRYSNQYVILYPFTLEQKTNPNFKLKGRHLYIQVVSWLYKVIIFTMEATRSNQSYWSTLLQTHVLDIDIHLRYRVDLTLKYLSGFHLI